MTGFMLFVALHAFVLVSHSNCLILERGKMCLRKVRTATTGCEEEDFSEQGSMFDQKRRFRVEK